MFSRQLVISEIDNTTAVPAPPAPYTTIYIDYITARTKTAGAGDVTVTLATGGDTWWAQGSTHAGAEFAAFDQDFPNGGMRLVSVANGRAAGATLTIAGGSTNTVGTLGYHYGVD